MHNFLHSGKLGDIILSLPVIKHLGGGTVYIRENNPDMECLNDIEGIKPLLLEQEYINNVFVFPKGHYFDHKGIPIDYDLDKFRTANDFQKAPITDSYFSGQNIKPQPIEVPFIKLSENDFSKKLIKEQPYSVLNLTHRYKTSFEWEWWFLDLAKDFLGKLYFVGLPEEFDQVSQWIKDIEYYPTKDLLELAYVINGAKALCCNQSLCYTLGIALNKKTYAEVTHQHCIFNWHNIKYVNRKINRDERTQFFSRVA